ncbi:hypothetical protein D1O30_06955 [Methylocystis hirsuta]|uniref:Uncharacterized protein n=1 Tax=Methylocystis hirsuta TaxID=369798 RepID=A0A3M9XM72_9HYPH|nr:hypothetical protein D1O30_06955 [Methylocystis hirsuta]
MTEERVRQFRKEGRLTPGADGLYDLQAALEYRPLAVSEGEAVAICSTVKERKPAPSSAAAVDPDLECLGVDFPLEVLVKAPTMSATSRVAELRAEMERVKLDRLKRNDLIEEGRLIERSEVYRTSSAAAADILAMLRALEHEIAALFPDHTTRVEVRNKVGNIVDRALFALHKKFDALARPLDEDDEI